MNRTEPRIHFEMQGFEWCACKSCRVRYVHENWADPKTPCGCKVCVTARTRRPLKAKPEPIQPWDLERAA